MACGHISLDLPKDGDGAVMVINCGGSFNLRQLFISGPLKRDGLLADSVVIRLGDDLLY